MAGSTRIRQAQGVTVVQDDAVGDDAVERWATGRLLSTAARLVEHAWDAHLARWGLNHASFAVLWMLDRGPLAQRTLAVAASVQDQTMSRMLERLERLGYVERRRSAQDRRQVLVSLTAEGDRVRAQAKDDELAESLLSRAVPDLGPLRADLVVLVRHLSRDRQGPGVASGP